MVGCPDSGGEGGETWLCDQKSWGCFFFSFELHLSGAVGAVVRHVCDVMNVCMYVYVFCDFYLFYFLLFLSGSVNFFVILFNLFVVSFSFFLYFLNLFFFPLSFLFSFFLFRGGVWDIL